MATYTDTQRSEALALYVEHGASEAARRLDMPARTIRHWANQAQLAKARTQNLEEAAGMLAAEHKAMREELRVRLLEKALDALDRMDAAHVDYRGKDARRVEWEVAPSGAFKDYATGAAILIDKYRLEMGEHTDRQSHLSVSPIDLELERVIAEHARQERD